MNGHKREWRTSGKRRVLPDRRKEPRFGQLNERRSGADRRKP